MAKPEKDDVIRTKRLEGVHVFDGGAGSDTLRIDRLDSVNGESFASVRLDDVINGSQLSGSSLVNIENITVARIDPAFGFIELFGNGANNVLKVADASGDVILEGVGGDDTLSADDVFFAHFYPGEGNDVVNVLGGTLNSETHDALTAIPTGNNTGDDVYNFARTSEDSLWYEGAINTDFGNDYVNGFTKGQDKIVIQPGLVADYAPAAGGGTIIYFASGGSVVVDAPGLQQSSENGWIVFA